MRLIVVREDIKKKWIGKYLLEHTKPKDYWVSHNNTDKFWIFKKLMQREL